MGGNRSFGILLGHEDLKTNQLYAKVVDQSKDDAMRQLGKIFERKSAQPRRAVQYAASAEDLKR